MGLGQIWDGENGDFNGYQPVPDALVTRFLPDANAVRILITGRIRVRRVFEKGLKSVSNGKENFIN